MVICIYGAASSTIDEKYKKQIYSLAEKLAKKGHSLVYGCGATGIMGSAASAFKDNGAFVHGVIPHFFVEHGYEGVFNRADKITYTETMAERKAIMEDECDAFIVASGGCGTLEELFQILTLKQLGRHKKAIAIFNQYGFYDKLVDFIEDLISKNFINKECRDLYKVIDSEDEIIDYILNYSPDGIKWSRLKKTTKPKD